MEALSNLNPDRLTAFILILCYLLIAIGIIKLALFLLMILTPGIWETLIEKENAFYVRIGLMNEKGSEVYKKLERGPWAKAFFGCGGIATILIALFVIFLARLMNSVTNWPN